MELLHKALRHKSENALKDSLCRGGRLEAVQGLPGVGTQRIPGSPSGARGALRASGEEGMQRGAGPGGTRQGRRKTGCQWGHTRPWRVVSGHRTPRRPMQRRDWQTRPEPAPCPGASRVSRPTDLRRYTASCTHSWLEQPKMSPEANHPWMRTTTLTHLLKTCRKTEEGSPSRRHSYSAHGTAHRPAWQVDRTEEI